MGEPETAPLETESGIPAGPEAPKYIVKAVDFLATPENLILPEAILIDFDQAFRVTSPPKEMLGTPFSNLAPEVALGFPASPASDVWALGCSIFRLRSGRDLFGTFEVTSPADLLRAIMQVLGDLPTAWKTILFDKEGHPTQDPANGEPLWTHGQSSSLKDLVSDIWDESSTKAGVRNENQPTPRDTTAKDVSVSGLSDETKQYNTCFLDMVYNPMAAIPGHVFEQDSSDIDQLVASLMTKIGEEEASLLTDLLSTLLAYDPADRPKVGEIMSHPWFGYRHKPS